MKSIGGAILERLCEHPNFNSVGDILEGLDLGGVLQQARPKAGLNQRELAAIINKNPISRPQETCQQWRFPIPTCSEGNLSVFGVSVKKAGKIMQFQALGRNKESMTIVVQMVLEFIKQDCPQFVEPPSPPYLSQYVHPLRGQRPDSQYRPAKAKGTSVCSELAYQSIKRAK